MASILNLPEMTCWLSLRVAAIALRSCCLAKGRELPQSWQPNTLQRSVAGLGRNTCLSWIWTHFLFHSFADPYIPSHSDRGPLFQELGQTLVFLEKNQARFLSLGRERLVTSPVINVIIRVRTKSSLTGIYRDIFQRTCKSNQALKSE